MKLFLLTSSVPFRDDGQSGVSAAHVVAYQLLTAFTRLGHRVTLQVLFPPGREPAPTREERPELGSLRDHGVEVLEPLPGPAPVAPRRPSLLLGSPDPREFYPELALRPIVHARMREARADVALPIWSPPGAAAATGQAPIPVVSYQGTIDYDPLRVRILDWDLFNGAPANPGERARQIVSRWRAALMLRRFRRAHMDLMRQVTVIANVTATNVLEYEKAGHRGAVYVGNTWKDPGRATAERLAGLQHERPRGRTLRIIGHLGTLGMTGSTYGLAFLLREVMPALRERLRGLSFEVHVIGGGRLAPPLEPLACQDNLVMRGFVENLAPELESADAFLLLNNVGSISSAYTRHVIAWAMGGCLIVHADSRPPVPELEPGRNALAGRCAGEIAEAVLAVVTDPGLNARLRLAGRQTYEKHFAPLVVAGRILAELRRLCPAVAA